MSYADRLDAFNQAVSHTNEHIDSIKKTLTNPELEENPAKRGLEIAGSVLGTGQGILGVKRGLEDKGFLRRGFKAIAQRLGGNKAPTTGSGTTGEPNGGGQPEGTESRPTGASDEATGADEGSGGGFIEDDAQGTIGGSGEPAQDPDFGDISRFRTGTIEGEPDAPSFDTSALGSEGLEFDDDPTGGASAPAEADAGGGARTGTNASRTLARDGEGVPDEALPNSTGGGTAEDLGVARGTAEDVSDVSRATQGGVEEGQQTLEQAQALQGRTAQALGQSGTADSASGQANMVSQAQHGNATQHQQQTNPDGESQADSGTQGADAQAQANRGGQQASGSEADSGGVEPNPSAGAQTADDGVQTGLKTAEGVEEGLDETLGEVPVIGPLLEGFSLLATLGTTIASAFTPSEKKGKSPAQKGVALPSELAVGANLKADSSGAVGAY